MHYKSSELAECTARQVAAFLLQLEDHSAGDLHRIVMEEVEATLIAEVLRITSGNLTASARHLGVSRNTLKSKIQKYQIHHQLHS